MFVCCECCVLSGRGLCDELITRAEESFRLWCVVRDLENLNNEEAMTRVGPQRHSKKENDAEGLAPVSSFKNTKISAGTTCLLVHVRDSDSSPRRNMQ